MRRMPRKPMGSSNAQAAARAMEMAERRKRFVAAGHRLLSKDVPALVNLISEEDRKMKTNELLQSARNAIELLKEVVENFVEKAVAIGDKQSWFGDFETKDFMDSKLEDASRHAMLLADNWLAEELKSRTKVAEQSAFFEKFNEQVGRVESAGLSSALHVIMLLQKTLDYHAEYISRGEATEELEELDALFKRSMEESRAWVHAYDYPGTKCRLVPVGSVFYDGPVSMPEVPPSAVEKAFELVRDSQSVECDPVQDGNRSSKSSVRAEAFDTFRDRSVKSLASDIADHVITFLKDFMTPVVKPIEVQEVKESRARAELERLRSMPDCAFIAPPVELVIAAEKKSDESLSKESVATLEKMLAHIIESKPPLVRSIESCDKHASDLSSEDKLLMEIGSDVSLVEIGLLSFGCNGGGPTDPVEMVKVNVALLQNVQTNLCRLSELIEKSRKEPKQ